MIRAVEGAAKPRLRIQKMLLIEEAFTILCYTFPLADQIKLLNQRLLLDERKWCFIDEIVTNHPDRDLLSSCLFLYIQELSFRREKPLDYHQRLKLSKHICCTNKDTIQNYILGILENKNGEDPVTIQKLLKSRNLPSVIPALSKIFRCTDKIISAFNPDYISKESKNTDLSPFWSELVLSKFSLEKTMNTAELPADVLKQSRLYLDTEKPFLLFSFNPQDVQSDQLLAFGQLSFVQKWAKKLATRIVPASMLEMGRLDCLPSDIPPLVEAKLEVKDASRATGFPPYEPISTQFTDFVDFDSGIRRALSLYSVKSRVESLWIFKQLPANGELSTSHAGMIFGFGLCGHLSGFKAPDAYELLSMGSEHVTSAVLVGMASSFIGTGHSSGFVPQMIGIHIPGYIPTLENPSAQLSQVPLPNQISAVLGLGLVFKGTGDRRIRNVLMKEIDRRGQVAPKSKIVYSPAYSTAAALSLGMVSNGEDLDEDYLDKLFQMVNSSDDCKVSSAFFAILGLFSGTHDTYYSSKIVLEDIHTSTGKPMHIFLRTLLRAMIEGTFPIDVVKTLKSLKEAIDRPLNGFYLCTHIAVLSHILAAYALFLGFHCAGMQDIKIVDQLKIMLNVAERTLRVPKSSMFDYHYRKKNLNFLKDNILLAMSLVMAGSGNKDVFLLLRASFSSLLGECPSRAYHHHLALGFLLIGNGLFTISTKQGKDRFSVSSLMASIYAGFDFPFMEDCHFSSHLFKWLWIFAVTDRKCVETTSKPSTEAPEDLFLEDHSSVPKVEYWSRMSSNGGVLKSLSADDPQHKRDLLFLEKLYQHLLEKDPSIFPDLMAVKQLLYSPGL